MKTSTRTYAVALGLILVSMLLQIRHLTSASAAPAKPGMLDTIATVAEIKVVNTTTGCYADLSPAGEWVVYYLWAPGARTEWYRGDNELQAAFILAERCSSASPP